MDIHKRFIKNEFFIIERVLYVFLLFYLGIAFLNIIIHWHVAIEFLKFVFNLDNIKYKGKNIGRFLPIPFFIVISCILFVNWMNINYFVIQAYFIIP